MTAKRKTTEKVTGARKPVSKNVGVRMVGGLAKVGVFTGAAVVGVLPQVIGWAGVAAGAAVYYTGVGIAAAGAGVRTGGKYLVEADRKLMSHGVKTMKRIDTWEVAQSEKLRLAAQERKARAADRKVRRAKQAEVMEHIPPTRAPAPAAA